MRRNHRSNLIVHIALLLKNEFYMRTKILKNFYISTKYISYHLIIFFFFHKIVTYMYETLRSIERKKIGEKRELLHRVT